MIRFGVYELNLDAAELRKQGVRLQLQPKQFQMLAVLLERPGEVVTRDELRRRLWDGDTFVDYEKPGASFTLNAGAAGTTVAYHCSIHSRMKGKMVADPASGQ